MCSHQIMKLYSTFQSLMFCAPLRSQGQVFGVGKDMDFEVLVHQGLLSQMQFFGMQSASVRALIGSMIGLCLYGQLLDPPAQCN